MLTKDKITEIFCIADDFCREFDQKIKEYTLVPSSDSKKYRNRKGMMSDSEVNLYDKLMLRKRSIIETINDVLKNVGQLVHSRHRSTQNFLMNLLSCIVAYTFCDTRPSINVDFVLDEGNSQLTLF